MITQELLDILACPFCKGDLRVEDDWLVCPACGPRFRLDREKGYANMLVQEALLPEGCSMSEPRQG